MGLHELDSFLKLGGQVCENLDPVAALFLAGVSNAIMLILSRRTHSHIATMASGNQMEHHVHCRRSAGTGQSIAIDLVESVRTFDVWKVLQECRPILPMDRASIAIEQPRAGQ